MPEQLLFTDVSLNPQLKIGMGAYLLLTESVLSAGPERIPKHEIINQIVVRKFENTSSTKLEIETVLWATGDLKQNAGKGSSGLKLFTDSQCVSGLSGRRKKLEGTGYISKSQGKELNHATLYKEFYKLQDELGFEVIKVAGHSPKSTHDTVTRIFSILDIHVRKLLKEWLLEKK
jgi:ribonuclease HI